MKKAFIGKKKQTILVLVISFISLIGSLVTLDHGKITAALLLGILSTGIPSIYLYNTLVSRMDKFEEAKLARIYQLHNINRMYKNIILFMIPILIFGWVGIRDNVIHREYTQRLKHNMQLSLNILTKEEIMGEWLKSALEDPIVNIAIRERKTKEAIITGALLIDTAQNISVTLSSLSSAKYLVENNYDTLDENKKDKLELIIEQLKERSMRIDYTYNELDITENSDYHLDSFIYNIAEFNLYFKEINEKILIHLENKEVTAEEFLKVMSDLEDKLERKVENVTTSLENNVLIKNPTAVGLEIIAFRIGWITAITSIIRLIGIIRYFVLVKRYRRKMGVQRGI